MLTITNQTVIKELHKLVELKREELQEAEQALRVVEKLLGQSSSIAKEPTYVPSSSTLVTTNGTINLDQLYFEANDTRKTLRQEVEDVIKTFGSQEFNVAHIDLALKKSGIKVNGKSPRARISTTLIQLEENQSIRKTFTGKGNIPHRYRAVATELFAEEKHGGL